MRPCRSSASHTPGSVAGRVSLVKSDHDSRRRILEILIAGKHRQICRAILLASLIATSIFGFRASIRPRQEPGPIFHRPSQPSRDMAPMIKRRRISACPAFETRPSRSFAPEECCRGTKQSHAAKSRPRLNCATSGPNAAGVRGAARAVSGPTPGMVHSRRAVYDRAARSFSFWSLAAIRADFSAICVSRS